jgi:hypothetical protein
VDVYIFMKFGQTLACFHEFFYSSNSDDGFRSNEWNFCQNKLITEIILPNLNVPNNIAELIRSEISVES